MNIDLNPMQKVSTMDVKGRRYVFDLTNITSEKVVGSEAALREASQMLATVVTLKPIVDAEYAQVKSACYARFHDDNTPNIKPGKKKTTSDWDNWKHTQPEYVAALQARDYIADLSKKLSMNYIPRLRDLTEETKSAERNVRAGENAQPTLPRVPVSPPAPSAPTSAPGAR